MGGEMAGEATQANPGSLDEPQHFKDVFDKELAEIECRRRKINQDLKGGRCCGLAGDLKGLALSGGGIRSATFCLGVLQKFNDLGLLTRFDYLSTVSGGGFIGGWWSAWLSRSQKTGLFPPREQIEPGREDLYRNRVTSGSSDSSMCAGVDPIHHLRLFSDYLTPRKGALSLDTWRAITVGLRNLLATWLILLPVMVAVILIAQLYFVGFQPEFFGASAELGSPEWSERVRLVLAPLIFLGGLFVTISFAWVINTWDSDPKGTRYIRQISVGSGLIAGALVTGALGYEALYLWSIQTGNPKGLFISPLHVVVSASLWLGVAIVILFLCYRRAIAAKCSPEELGTRLTQVSEAILIALVAVGLVLGYFGFVQEIWTYASSGANHYVVRAGGSMAVLGSIASIAFTLWKASPTGGGDLRAEGRRSAASQVVFAIAPPAALVLIGWLAAVAVDRLFEHALTDHPVMSYTSALVFVLLSLLCLGWEWKTGPQQARKSELLRQVFGPLYLLFLGVLIVLGVLVYWWPAELTKHPALFPEFLVFIGLALMFGWVGTFGWYVDPNALSLHGFYKARLTRAYLGASNFARRGTTSEITDAVSGDDVCLSELKNCEFGAPYHLINTTLNLVGGHDLSTAQRLAEPFLMSRHYCGAVGGYRPTKDYMNNRLTLGTAVAVSGAAVSPNMGSMTLGSALAMLLTFFNIRLGYWAPTPNQSSWRSPQARHWPWYTLREFMSQTTSQGKYCNLSDGGHFDNTGVYSLIQRACKFIVMVDCGADPRPCFQDLGEVIRRCRIDFGAEIDIDITELADTAPPVQVTRCLRGTIKYSDEHLRSLGRPRQDRPATLILIKPSLTAEEATGGRPGGNPRASADIRQFRLTNSDYPQISTADQWFSEAQFESYRQLGELSAETAYATFLEKLMT
jgi:hypothetical protein